MYPDPRLRPAPARPADRYAKGQSWPARLADAGGDGGAADRAPQPAAYAPPVGDPDGYWVQYGPLLQKRRRA